MPSGCGTPQCLVGTAGDMNEVGHVAQCDPSFMSLSGNKYFTPDGNATLNCGGAGDLGLADVQRQFKNEVGSTTATLPTATEAVKWADEVIAGWGSAGQTR